MTTATATIRTPAFHPADRVELPIVAICASPACTARVAEAPSLKTLSLTSTPCLTYRPFSTATNCGTWFMLFTVAIVICAGPCPEAIGPAPTRRHAATPAVASIRYVRARRMVPPPAGVAFQAVRSLPGLAHPGLLHEHRSGVVLARAVAVGEDQFSRLGRAQVLQAVDHPRRDVDELVLRDRVLLALLPHEQPERSFADEERGFAGVVVRLVPSSGRDPGAAHRDRGGPHAVLVHPEGNDERRLIGDVLVDPLGIDDGKLGHVASSFHRLAIPVPPTCCLRGAACPTRSRLRLSGPPGPARASRRACRTRRRTP